VPDKLSDEPEQIDKSPYAYVWDDPIGKNDPDGNCPMCIGALAGALLDVGTQLVEMHFDPNKKFSYAEVGLSAVTGAAGVGIAGKVAGLVEAGVSSKFVGTLIKRGVDATTSAVSSAVSQKALTGKVDLKKVAIDGIAGVVGGHFGDKMEQKAAKFAGGKLLAAQASRLTKKAMGGGANKGLRAAAAVTKLTNFTQSRAAAVAVGTTGTLGTAVKDLTTK
jgi:hypothetical protein